MATYSYPYKADYSYPYTWFTMWKCYYNNNPHFDLRKQMQTVSDRVKFCDKFFYYMCCVWACDWACNLNLTTVESTMPSWKEMRSIYDPLTTGMTRRLYLDAFTLMHDIKRRIMHMYHQEVAKKIFANKEDNDLFTSPCPTDERHEFERLRADGREDEYWKARAGELHERFGNLNGHEWFYKVMMHVARKISSYNEALVSVDLGYGISLTKSELCLLIASVGFFYPCIEMYGNVVFDDNTKKIIKQCMYEYFTQ